MQLRVCTCVDTYECICMCLYKYGYTCAFVCSHVWLYVSEHDTIHVRNVQMKEHLLFTHSFYVFTYSFIFIFFFFGYMGAGGWD